MQQTVQQTAEVQLEPVWMVRFNMRCFYRTDMYVLARQVRSWLLFFGCTADFALLVATCIATLLRDRANSECAVHLVEAALLQVRRQLSTVLRCPGSQVWVRRF